MKFTRLIDSEKVHYSHLQGYVFTEYSKLVELFGEPTKFEYGSQQDVEWCLEFEDETIATIYNYKDGKNYLGEQGDEVEDITDWHVGGFDSTAVSRVNEVLQA